MNSGDSEAGAGGSVQFDESGMPVRVSRRSFRAFSRWIDGELYRLVARWQHLASPSAQRIEAPARRPRKPR